MRADHCQASEIHHRLPPLSENIEQIFTRHSDCDSLARIIFQGVIVAKNQIRAVSLARALAKGTTDAAALSDNDWYLLLLAAGMNQASASGSTLCKRVLEAANSGTGYFMSITPARLAAGAREAAGVSILCQKVQGRVSDAAEQGWRQGVAATATALIRAIVRAAGRGMIGECARQV